MGERNENIHPIFWLWIFLEVNVSALFHVYNCFAFRLNWRYLWLSAIRCIPSDYHRAGDGGWRSQVPSWMFLLHIMWWLHWGWRVICSSGAFQTVLVSVQFHYYFIMYYYLYVLFKTTDFSADLSYSLRFEMYLNLVNRLFEPNCHHVDLYNHAGDDTLSL